MFCEAGHSENHTIEAWDLVTATATNITDPGINARKPSAVTVQDRFFLAYEIIEGFGADMNSTVALCDSTSFTWLRFIDRRVFNASSPSLSPMPIEAGGGFGPYLIYTSGPNSSYTNQIWFETYEDDISVLLYSGLNNITSPRIAVSKDFNSAMITFENWTYEASGSFRRSAGYIVAELTDSEPEILEIGSVVATEPLRSPPLVSWGLLPDGDAFFLGFHNGSTCCIIYYPSSLESQITERTPKHGFPMPNIMNTHLKATRWIPMTVCELESRSIFVGSYSFNEDAHYHYYPVPIDRRNTMQSINLFPFLGFVFLLFLGLFLVLSFISYRHGYLAAERKHAFQFVFLLLILGVLLSINYMFASFFASVIVLLVNFVLEIAFICAIGKLIYSIMSGNDGRSEEEETELTEESSVSKTSHLKSRWRILLWEYLVILVLVTTVVLVLISIPAAIDQVYVTVLTISFAILAAVFGSVLSRVGVANSERNAVADLMRALEIEMKRVYAVAVHRPGNLLSMTAWECLVHSGKLHYLKSDVLVVLATTNNILGFRNYELANQLAGDPAAETDVEKRRKLEQKAARVVNALDTMLARVFGIDSKGLDTTDLLAKYYDLSKWPELQVDSSGKDEDKNKE